MQGASLPLSHASSWHGAELSAGKSSNVECKDEDDIDETTMLVVTPLKKANVMFSETLKSSQRGELPNSNGVKLRTKIAFILCLK
jgi:hypothetical protein